MRRNVGGADRGARVVVGIALALASMGIVALGGDLGRTVQLVAAAATLLLAAILLATAGAQQCPINRALGRDTYRGESRL